MSRRLDLEWLPNVPVWSLPTVVLGSTVYYRLTATVLHWLDLAGQQLERDHLAGHLDRSQIDIYLTAMTQVHLFASRHLAPSTVEAAKSKAATLPDVTGPM